MKRQVIYSGSKPAPGDGQGAGAPDSGPARVPAPAAAPWRQRLRAWAARHTAPLLLLAGAACVALVAGGIMIALRPAPPALNQAALDTAVTRALQTRTPPSRAVKAAEIVRPSVVLVRGFNDAKPAKGRAKAKKKKRPSGRIAPEESRKKPPEGDPEGMEETSLGTGVVIVDDGTILTNLHVVYGVKRVIVTFHDGSKSEAALVSIHPENDLAVIKALKIPDDLPPATLGSAARLKPGDEVAAVGYPFGMGPSVSYGVVSGLNREFRSPEGEQVLTRLIQFDAAANPGNSGGPLITMQGDVVGIVTAIFNPTEARTFAGVAFAVTIAVAAGNVTSVHPF